MNRQKRYVVTLLSVYAALAALAAPAAGQARWTSFRNGGSGTTVDEHPPTRWSPDANVAWRAEVSGYGQSSPVVWGDTVFVTSSEGPWQEHGYVHAFDLQTGDPLWTREAPASTRVENYFRNSRAAPTPVVDAERVVAFFPGGDVTALSHDGETLWSVSLFERFGAAANERGTASSLAQTDDLVLVVVDHDGPSYAVALSKADGGVVWSADRGEREPSWASPVATRHGGRDLLVVSSSQTLDAYEAATGRVLWQVKGLQGNLIPSATVAGGAVFVGSTQMHHGRLEADAVAASNCRIDLSDDAEEPGYRLRWNAERVNSYYSSPLSFAGYVYYVNKSGVLYCCDAETGEEAFRERIGAPCWASPVGVTTPAGESLAYFPMKDGRTLVLRPGPRYDEVARNELWDEEQLAAAVAAARLQRRRNRPTDKPAPADGSPEAQLSRLPEQQLHQIFSYGDPIVYALAVADGRLLLRTGQHLYCVAGEQ